MAAQIGTDRLPCENQATAPFGHAMDPKHIHENRLGGMFGVARPAIAHKMCTLKRSVFEGSTLDRLQVDDLRKLLLHHEVLLANN